MKIKFFLFLGTKVSTAFFAMIKSLRHFLNQPHPGYSDFRVYFMTITGIFFFVALILIIYQPFNVASIHMTLSPHLTGLAYASGAFITMALSYGWIWCFKRFFSTSHWTIGKEILLIFYQMSSIAFSVWMMTEVLSNFKSETNSLTRALFIVISTGLPPYLMMTLIRHNYLLNKNLKQAKYLNEAIQSKNHEVLHQHLNIPKLKFPLKISNFYFAESRGNNLILATSQESNFVFHEVRMSMSEFEKENNQYNQLFRCHRSFIINLEKIEQVEGNAAGYRILLHNLSSKIPVSRANIDKFNTVIFQN